MMLWTQQLTLFQVYVSSLRFSVSSSEPSGFTSMDLPQKRRRGLMLPRITKCGDSACQALMGGWWETCSRTMRVWAEGTSNSKVSPSSGLKGLFRRR